VKRRERSATESLLTIVLGLEGLLVFFAALSIYGTRAATPAVAFGAALAMIVVILVATRALRYRGGHALGWVVQAALIAAGLLVPLMYLIGVGFTALWIFCFVRGRQLDTQKAAFLAALPKENNA
jgi:hypothetical protein